MISTMTPPDLYDDKKTISLALEAFCNLGMDGGIGEDIVWLIIDDSTAKAKQKCADDLSILEMIGTDNIKMISTFGRKWKTQFQSNSGVGSGQWLSYLDV